LSSVCTTLDDDDLRKLPRYRCARTNLARLLTNFIAPFETGEIGPDLFRHACLMGLEGLVSKHRESAYGAGIR
jgi:bifunctional non-homologous end joining protein LigD